MDVEGCALLEDRVGDAEHRGERLGVRECAVRDRMQVREVDHRPHPRQLRRDREHVLGGPELAHAAHHLDPERHRPALALEALAQLAQLLDHRRQRLLRACARAGTRGG